MARLQESRLSRRNGIYQISYYQQGKHYRESTGTRNRKVAMEILRKKDRDLIIGNLGLMDELSSALYDPRRRDRVMEALEVESLKKVDQALSQYLDESKIHKRPKTISSDRGRLVSFFKWVDLDHVNEIRTRDVSAYMAYKSESVCPTTLLRIREILHAFFEYLISQGDLRQNPVKGVARPKIYETDIEFLNQAEIRHCLEILEGDRLEPLVATAIYAGLRREELCWLTPGDLVLDEERPLLRVCAKQVGAETWQPKTRKNRTVPISPDLFPYLSKQRLKQGPATWLFPTLEGCRWDPDNLGKRLRLIMNQHSRDWSLLTLRHTFASQMAQKGVSLYKISQLMGNSPAIAQKHYARLLPEQMHEEVHFMNEQNVRRVNDAK